MKTGFWGILRRDFNSLNSDTDLFNDYFLKSVFVWKPVLRIHLILVRIRIKVTNISLKTEYF